MNQKNKFFNRQSNQMELGQCIKWMILSKFEAKYQKFDQLQQWLTFFIPTITQIEKQVLLSILQNFKKHTK